MNWSDDFLLQARSDFEVRNILIKQKVHEAHQFHYLQMATEKLAKGLFTSDKITSAPKATHVAFVKGLRYLKGHPGFRADFGYDDAQAFSQYVDSLLPMARRIEELAPSVPDGPPSTFPNPEYPWQAPNSGSDDVVAPCQFDFNEFLTSNPGEMVRFGQRIYLIEKMLEFFVPSVDE